jgi:lambda family phage tail tape measure protein
MRMLAVKAISESGGSFSIISSIGKMFMGGGPTAGPEELGDSSGMWAAKGKAFDNGVQAFAKGGMFTNSVVNSPTLFKFAKGTGMMGEAGPEAIMPLKRNSNGVLGVEGGGGGGETNVIINNYGPSKTETKKTVDSRGNKTIEVIVGDAVAGEIRRSGSPAQESIKSTFGRQPQLIRR